MDKIVLYLLDDNGICRRERISKLSIAGFDPIAHPEESEYNQYFHIYWIRNPVEIWAWTFLASKVLSVEAKRLNKLLPDILCIDYALKARDFTSEEYEFATPVETYISKANLSDPDLTQKLLKLSPLPELREAAFEAGLNDEIIEMTRFDQDEEFVPPNEADYTIKPNEIANELKPGAIDQMGALGGRLMHLLVANSYGTVCVGNTAHNLDDFKKTELAYAEYILGESRNNVTFLCTRRSGDQGEKRNARWKPLIDEGVQNLRDRLMELGKSGIVEFNLFELRKLSKTNGRGSIPADLTVSIKTNIGVRKLPLNGLFIDIKEANNRAQEMREWVKALIDTIMKRLCFSEDSLLNIQEAIALTEELYRSYQNETLRRQRYDLSKLLSQTLNHWKNGKTDLPEYVETYLQRQEGSVSRNALSRYCRKWIEAKHPRTDEGRREKNSLQACFNNVFRDVPEEILDCVERETSCTIEQKSKNEDVKRWACFFTYARLYCDLRFHRELYRLYQNCELTKENINRLSEPQYFRPDDISENMLYDALYPLPSDPLILPFDSNERSYWKTPVNLSRLVENGLTEEKKDNKKKEELFRRGELKVVRDYVKTIWQSLKDESIKQLDSKNSQG